MTWEEEIDIIFEERNLSNDTAYIECDGSVLDILKEKIKSLLKQQRENCLNQYIEDVNICGTGQCPECDMTRDAILNAPEPSIKE